MGYHAFKCLQRESLMQTITSVVLFTFVWLLIHPAALAAQTLAQSQPPAQSRPPGAEAEFAETLERVMHVEPLRSAWMYHGCPDETSSRRMPGSRSRESPGFPLARE